MSDAPVRAPISVVICTRDRPDSFRPALDSVLAQDYPNFEVVVVDQSRGGDTEAIVAGARAGGAAVRYVYLDRPGLSRAYNAGVRSTTSELLAFTDDDVVAPRDWLSRIAAAFAAYPGSGLIYGQVLVAPELQARESKEGVTPGLPITKRRILDRRHGFRIFGMGANFAVRRRLFEHLGGFDEVLGGGGPLQSSQDFDFMYRVYRKGESTLLEPDVVVYHYGFRAYSDWPATVGSYGVGVGGFCLKHIRLGDLYAARVLGGFVGVAGLRMVKRVITLRAPGEQWTFLSSVLKGMRGSLAFPIDRRLRLYQVPS
jgi:glycosyltransferase involved in cell wall biosynthesis